MAMIILTAEDAFRKFLEGIRSFETSIVKPEIFNSIINDAQIDWVYGKLPLQEFNQKRVDDLLRLRVVLSGGSILQPKSGSVAGLSSFDAPVTFDNVDSAGQLNSTCKGYPLYLRGINASFLVGGTEVRGRIKRSDKSLINIENPFRKPSDSRPYFEIVDNEIRVNGLSAISGGCRLEYYRYPRLIEYSETLPINPEFTPAQNKEIVDIAVQIYLERRSDPRYKSYLQERMIRSQNN